MKISDFVKTVDGRLGVVLELKRGVEYPTANVRLFSDGEVWNFERHDLTVVDPLRMSSLEKRAAGLLPDVSGPVGQSGLREKPSRPTYSWAQRNLGSKR